MCKEDMPLESIPTLSLDDREGRVHASAYGMQSHIQFRGRQAKGFLEWRSPLSSQSSAPIHLQSVFYHGPECRIHLQPISVLPIPSSLSSMSGPSLLSVVDREVLDTVSKESPENVFEATGAMNSLAAIGILTQLRRIGMQYSFCRRSVSSV